MAHGLVAHGIFIECVRSVPSVGVVCIIIVVHGGGIATENPFSLSQVLGVESARRTLGTVLLSCQITVG